MALKEQLAKQTMLGVITAGLSMFFGVASFFLLTKILPREDIAIIGLSSGFLAMVSPLLISPDVALFRNYAELKKDFNKYVSSILYFWVGRTVLVMGIIALVAYTLFFSRGDFLFWYVLGAGLVLNLSTLQASIQEVFSIEFKQKDVLIYNFAYYTLFLLLLTSVYFLRELWVYLLIWLGLTIFFTLAWLIRLRRVFHFSPARNIRDVARLVRMILGKVAIWTHLISSTMQLVYRADVFFVGLFALAFVTGNYTIALLFSSVFVLVPQILQKMCITGLTRSSTIEQDLKITNAFVKYSLIWSIIQVVGYFILGKFVIAWIDSSNTNTIFELGWYIVLGVSLFNVVRPLHGLCYVRADLKKLFAHVFLPTGAGALVLYAGTAYFVGSLATAQANVAVYGLLTLLLVHFARGHVHYRWKGELVTREEWDLLKKIRARVLAGR